MTSAVSRTCSRRDVQPWSEVVPFDRIKTLMQVGPGVPVDQKDDTQESQAKLSQNPLELTSNCPKPQNLNSLYCCPRYSNSLFRLPLGLGKSQSSETWRPPTNIVLNIYGWLSKLGSLFGSLT